MKTVPTVTRTGLAPHAGPTHPWMNTTEGSLRPVDTAPGNTIVNARPAPCAQATMTAMPTDAARPRVPGWKTMRLPAVHTRTPMMPGLRPLRATTMTLIWRRGPMDDPAPHPEVTTLRMSVPATGR